MNIRKDQLIKILFGGFLGALGSVVMELANQQAMNETISEEVQKQLAEYNAEGEVEEV